MTLTDIISAALEEIGRSTDSQSVSDWRDRFTSFINAGQSDLAQALRLRRTDEATITNGQLDVTTLPCECVKLLSIARDGTNLTFTRGPRHNIVNVAGAEDGTADVSYRYIPARIRYDTDEPDLPAYLHPLLVTYIIAREHSTEDPSMQRRSNVYYEMYEAAKAQARKDLGESDNYSFENVEF